MISFHHFLFFQQINAPQISQSLRHSRQLYSQQKLHSIISFTLPLTLGEAEFERHTLISHSRWKRQHNDQRKSISICQMRAQDYWHLVIFHRKLHDGSWEIKTRVVCWMKSSRVALDRQRRGLHLDSIERQHRCWRKDTDQENERKIKMDRQKDRKTPRKMER